MTPTLDEVILNGASRHRLDKGFILLGDGRRSVNASARDQIIRATNQALAAHPGGEIPAQRIPQSLG